MSKLRIGARALPRWVAVIILYVFILSGLGFFIGYFVPKLSGDFARLFREAPRLFAKVNKDWLPRAGAWIDTHFAPEEVDPDDDVTPRLEEPPGAARDRRRAAGGRALPHQSRRGEHRGAAARERQVT